MSEWISVKKALPLNDSYVKCKVCILYRTIKDCLFIKGYFVHKGENITRWVTAWIPNRQENKE
jgi:hypothetical protein